VPPPGECGSTRPPLPRDFLPWRIRRCQVLLRSSNPADEAETFGGSGDGHLKKLDNRAYWLASGVRSTFSIECLLQQHRSDVGHGQVVGALEARGGCVIVAGGEQYDLASAAR